ncbi:hypothetical protein L1987_35403 [Smallanthus sonchifolius]|uniref:Uncharacterized protein n=1 Tax=Smallanthus sonchifolius TaxID=185202 RepID=A0ACB9HXX8_9ASTR|nr:hypothetical protein L1987_35403 [Smallanthus sonchifolius]
MKDLSFFLLKNSLAFKMKKGFKNLCTGDASTSTLNQQNSPDHQPTLEEMIMQLDLEEKMAARPSLDHRMSCVNSSDILRSARNALNQYPRFSLDGKDAMYRSSFRNGNRSFLHLPTKVGGERVIWCKPGVVGKLMGLEAMPIPVRLKHKMNSCLVRKRNLMRQEIERRNHGSCSRYKPVAVKNKITSTDEVGWPMGRFM